MSHTSLVGYDFFPRTDVKTVRNDELRLLYVMVKKTYVSPIVCMIAQWQGIFHGNWFNRMHFSCIRIALGFACWKML